MEKQQKLSCLTKKKLAKIIIGEIYQRRGQIVVSSRHTSEDIVLKLFSLPLTLSLQDIIPHCHNIKQLKCRIKKPEQIDVISQTQSLQKTTLFIESGTILQEWFITKIPMIKDLKGLSIILKLNHQHLKQQKDFNKLNDIISLLPNIREISFLQADYRVQVSSNKCFQFLRANKLSNIVSLSFNSLSITESDFFFENIKVHCPHVKQLKFGQCQFRTISLDSDDEQNRKQQRQYQQNRQNRKSTIIELQYLSISHCRFQRDNMLFFFSSISNLTKIMLDNQRMLKMELQTLLKNNGSLKQIAFQSCDIDNQDIKTIAFKTKDLQKVNFSNDIEGPSNWFDHTQFHHLVINHPNILILNLGNREHQNIDKIIILIATHLKKLRQLWICKLLIRIDSCIMTNKAVIYLKKLKQLRLLNCASYDQHQVTDDIIAKVVVNMKHRMTVYVGCVNNIQQEKKVQKRLNENIQQLMYGIQ